MKQVILLSILCELFIAARSAYVNNFDAPVDFHCPNEAQAINRVQSTHDNGAEDRRFDLSCTDNLAGGTTQCFWTDYKNEYDKLLHYSCPTNHYINGMQSIHDSGPEDRKWKFYCCSIQDIHLTDCVFSGFTNDLDKDQNYNAPAGKVIKGVISIHDNASEDRQYEYEVCGFYHTGGDSVVG